MTNRHQGSNFDDFLASEGLHIEAEVTALKRVIAHQIEQALKEEHLSKREMARKMQTSRASLNRLLDPENHATTLKTLTKAAHALNRHFEFRLDH